MFVCSLPKEDLTLSTPLEVFDQGMTEKCEAYAATSIAEDHYGIRFDPEATYVNALKVSDGEPPYMVDVLEGIARYGLVPIDGGDPANYKAKSYSMVWGLYRSTFNLILGSLAKGTPILCGIYWQQEWDKVPGGVITSNYQNYKLFPHAIKAFGRKTINGKVMIQVLNSRGTSVGDNGVFYFGKDSELLSPYVIEF